MKESIYSKLLMVQTKLKAPKNLYNSYGGFKYRSAEGILEAVKPLLLEERLVMFITDDLEEHGERCFVKSTVKITDGEGGLISTQAAAEIAKEKKGMDAAQITGTSSSYARKYALNGMFLIDDVKDPDTDEFANQNAGAKMTQEAGSKKISKAKANALATRLFEANVNMDAMLSMYGVSSLEDLTEDQHLNIIRKLDKKK